MGRRQERLQERRRERAEGTTQASPPPQRPRRQRPAWRQSLDQWGGLPVIAGAIVVVAVLAMLVWRNLPEGAEVSEAPLMGQEVPITSAAHVDNPALMDIQPGVPPAGGPHFQRWLSPGFYDEPQQDGLIVHSLEHGVIWLSYNPDLISDEDLEVVRRVQRDFSNDVIASPRLDNDAPLYAVSWGRRMQVETPVDGDLLREFVRTNRNRSPEPFGPR